MESLTFVSVDGEGRDVYEADFAHGWSEWHIAPLTSEGKVQRVNFFCYPS